MSGRLNPSRSLFDFRASRVDRPTLLGGQDELYQAPVPVVSRHGRPRYHPDPTSNVDPCPPKFQYEGPVPPSFPPFPPNMPSWKISPNTSAGCSDNTVASTSRTPMESTNSRQRFPDLILTPTKVSRSTSAAQAQFPQSRLPSTINVLGSKTFIPTGPRGPRATHYPNQTWSLSNSSQDQGNPGSASASKTVRQPASVSSTPSVRPPQSTGKGSTILPNRWPPSRSTLTPIVSSSSCAGHTSQVEIKSTSYEVLDDKIDELEDEPIARQDIGRYSLRKPVSGMQPRINSVVMGGDGKVMHATATNPPVNASASPSHPTHKGQTKLERHAGSHATLPHFSDGIVDEVDELAESEDVKPTLGQLRDGKEDLEMTPPPRIDDLRRSDGAALYK